MMQFDQETVYNWGFRWAFRLALVSVGIIFLLGLLFDQRTILLIGICGGLVLFWSFFVEPQLLTVKRVRVQLTKQPSTYKRVAFLSDLHAGGGKGERFYWRLAERVMALKPDVILVGGDFVELHERTLHEIEPLKRLRAPGGIFFILGNHDIIDSPGKIRNRIQSWGWESVTNRRMEAQVEGKSLSIVGFDDVRATVPKAELLSHHGHPSSILLVHSPDDLEGLETGGVGVILCGHTHGGQVRLPLIGSILPLPMRAPRRYDRGVKDWYGTPFIISQGLGEALLPLRFFCPPQIVLLEIGV